MTEAQVDPAALVIRESGAPIEESSTSGRNLYSAEEYGVVQLPLAQVLEGDQLRLYPEVTAKGYFSVAANGAQLLLRAGHHIGLIPINDRVAIDVRPRIPLG